MQLRFQSLASEPSNEQLVIEGTDAAVTPAQLQEAFKKLTAVGFYVSNKSKHLKNEPPMKVVGILADNVQLESLQGRISYIPNSLFHITYKLL